MNGSARLLRTGERGCLGSYRKPMSTKPSGSENSIATKQQLIQNANVRSLSRAQENCYEFVLAGERHVNVRNTSYDEPGHVYTVAFEDGLPASCTCPAFKHHDGPCKTVDPRFPTIPEKPESKDCIGV